MKFLCFVTAHHLTEGLVCTIVDKEWDNDPYSIQEHKDKPEIFYFEICIKFWRPILLERE